MKLTRRDTFFLGWICGAVAQRVLRDAEPSDMTVLFWTMVTMAVLAVVWVVTWFVVVQWRLAKWRG